jgi:hypothetical protein
MSAREAERVEVMRRVEQGTSRSWRPRWRARQLSAGKTDLAAVSDGRCGGGGPSPTSIPFGERVAQPPLAVYVAGRYGVPQRSPANRYHASLKSLGIQVDGIH